MRAKLLQTLTLHSPIGGGRVNLRLPKWCRKQGLSAAKDFLDLSGEVISGHRDRHVVEVRVGGKKLFLKKEHRIPWGTRLRNWRDGFGAVSLSEREAATLTELRRANVPVPEWIACGENDTGLAFVLLRNARGTELRAALEKSANGFARWRLAKAIGEAVGRLHQAGFDAPDLSAKHVLVRRDGSIVLIDWPRAKRHTILNQNSCLAALAGLQASLAHELATTRERLAVLKSWMQTLGFHGPAAPLARQVIRLAAKLTQRRSIREQLRPSRDPRLRWIDGEALCVTRSYWQSVDHDLPNWLRDAAQNMVPWRTTENREPNTQLICFPPAPRWRQWLAAALRRPIQSNGIRQAALAFRLARHRVPVVPILAFGGRREGGGVLLCQVLETMRPARAWLALPRPGRRSMLRRVGQLLRRCHDAGCRGVSADTLMVDTLGRPRLRLVPNGELFSSSPTARNIADDLAGLSRGLGLISQRDRLRVIRGYFGADAINAATMRTAAKALGLRARRAA